MQRSSVIWEEHTRERGLGFVGSSGSWVRQGSVSPYADRLKKGLGTFTLSRQLDVHDSADATMHVDGDVLLAIVGVPSALVLEMIEKRDERGVVTVWSDRTLIADVLYVGLRPAAGLAVRVDDRCGAKQRPARTLIQAILGQEHCQHFVVFVVEGRRKSFRDV